MNLFKLFIARAVLQNTFPSIMTQMVQMQLKFMVFRSWAWLLSPFNTLLIFIPRITANYSSSIIHGLVFQAKNIKKSLCPQYFKYPEYTRVSVSLSANLPERLILLLLCSLYFLKQSTTVIMKLMIGFINLVKLSQLWNQMKHKT